MTDANGIATEYMCSPAGLVGNIVRWDGADVMTSLAVAYGAAIHTCAALARAS